MLSLMLITVIIMIHLFIQKLIHYFSSNFSYLQDRVTGLTEKNTLDIPDKLKEENELEFTPTTTFVY